MKRKRYPQIRFKGFNNDWEQRKFKDYGSVAMCKRIFKYETSDSGDVPFYKIGTFGNKADAFITNEKYEYYKSKFSFPNKGDILLSASGTIGRIVEYSGKKAYFQDSNIVWLNHNDNIKNSFLKVLYPIVKWDGIEGSTIKRLYNSNFLSTEIHVPKVKEQEKIGVLFEKIDNLITLHQNKHDKLVEIKKSLLEKMFPKNNKKIPEIRFKGFTDNWKQHKLDELGIIQTGNTPSTVKKEYYSNTGIQWVTPTDITDNVIRTTERKLSRIGAKVGRIVPPNTILVTCIASIGKNAIVTEKSAFNQQINSLTPYFEKHNPYFLLADSINWSNTMKKEAGGLTFQIVNKSQFSKIETKVPKEKQEEEKIGVLFKTIDKLVTLYQHNLINLINLKKTLLRKMFI